MAYLQNEKSRFQAESQAAGAEIANLTAQLQLQQQAIVAAEGRVSVARSALADAQARIPNLESAAARADRRVADLDLQITEHRRNEPPEEIQTRPDKPARPNPEWDTWKEVLDPLTEQRGQARTSATVAHARLNEGRARVSQATAEVQAAERQVAEATSPLNSIHQAIAAARERQASAQTMLTLLDRWNEEIARDPVNRKTLEAVAAILSDRATVLEDAHAVARVQNEIAEETLSSLSARREHNTAALRDVTAQLSAASEELRAANAMLLHRISRIEMHVQGGP